MINVSTADLHHARLLVLEDEPLIAMDLTLMLEDAGATVAEAHDVASANRTIDAMLEGGGVDGAVLDMDLGHETSDAVATRLTAMGVPFVYHTGSLPGDARMGAPVVTKPSRPGELLRVLEDIVAH